MTNKEYIEKYGYENFLLWQEKKKQYRKAYYLSHKEIELSNNKETCKKWRQSHSEYCQEYQKQYRQEHKEQLSFAKKKFHALNHDELSQKRKDRYWKNREDNINKSSEYQKEHRTERNTYLKKYRATKQGRAAKLAESYRRLDKKANRDNDIDQQWIIDNIFNNHCVYCGTTNFKILGCDRIDNSLGHLKDNVVCSCYFCNIERQWRNLSHEEMIEYRNNNPLNVEELNNYKLNDTDDNPAIA